MDSVYNEAASLGRTAGNISFFLSIGVAVIFLIIGLVFLIKKPIDTSDPMDKDKKDEAPVNQIIGWIFVVFAVLLILYAFFVVKLLRSSKPIAALAGADVFVQGVKDIL